MTLESLSTAEKLDGPRVNQFSIFLPNKVGALLDVVRLMSEHHVDVVAINVQDSADTAIVRIVVTDPESVERTFANMTSRFPSANSAWWNSGTDRPSLASSSLPCSPRR